MAFSPTDLPRITCCFLGTCHAEIPFKILVRHTSVGNTIQPFSWLLEYVYILSQHISLFALYDAMTRDVLSVSNKRMLFPEPGIGLGKSIPRLVPVCHHDLAFTY